MASLNIIVLMVVVVQNIILSPKAFYDISSLD